MSFHSPLPAAGSGSPAQGGAARRVRCDLPARLEVLPDEVALIETWLGDHIAELFGGNGAAFIDPNSDSRKEVE